MAKKDKDLRDDLNALLQKHEHGRAPDTVLANFVSMTLIAYDTAGFCSDSLVAEGEEQPAPGPVKLQRDSVLVEILKWCESIEVDKQITGNDAISLADAILAAAEPDEPAEPTED